MPVCVLCHAEFPNRQRIDDKIRNLKNRKLCLKCSPFGEHTQAHNLLPRKRNFTDDQFMEAVKNNITIKAVLLQLKLSPRGNNYKLVHRLVEQFNLDVSHWSVELSNSNTMKKKYLSIKRDASKILCLGTGVKNECAMCHLSVWQGQPLSLQLHHINGQWDDNRENNLLLLCPNCHSLTDTFCGKKNETINKACACGARIKSKSTQCVKCYKGSRKLGK